MVEQPTPLGDYEPIKKKEKKGYVSMPHLSPEAPSKVLMTAAL